ncbi:MAG: YihY/virulence factor BrkB family protein [Gemmatimonadaceae bacterium]
MTIRGYDVGVLLRKTVAETLKDNVLGLSAQAAYSFFFSLFPILLFLAPLFSLIGNKQEVVNRLLTRLSMTLPIEAYLLLSSVVKDVVFSDNAPGLISVGIVLAAFSGSGVVDTLRGALNTAYDAHDPRSWWKLRIFSMLFTVVAGIVMGASTLVMVAGPEVLGFIGDVFRIGSQTTRIWTILQYPIALLLVVAFVASLFYFLPNVKQKITHVLVGAAVTVLLWIVITLLFRLYVTNFGSYNKTYGTIGAVIILLTWMYWTMIAVLIGGELAAELNAGTGQTNMIRKRQPSEALQDAAIAEKARF